MPAKGKKGKKGPPESGWMPGFGTKGIRVCNIIIRLML